MNALIINPEASNDDIKDQLYIHLAQCSALIGQLCSNDSYNDMNEEMLGQTLWTINMMMEQATELCSKTLELSYDKEVQS